MKPANNLKILGLIILSIISVSVLVSFYTDLLWFSSLGLEKILIIEIEARLLVFFVSATIFGLFAYLNLLIAKKLRHDKKAIVPGSVKLGMIALFSALIGSGVQSQWFTIMQFFKQVPFGITEPIFMKDISFYVFTLPFFQLLWEFAMTVAVLSLIFTALDYFQSLISKFLTQGFGQQMQGGMSVTTPVNWKKEISAIQKKAVMHLAALSSLIFALLSVQHYLNRYSIMYSEEGFVVGAGYTDVVVLLPAMKLLMVLALGIAVSLYFWMAMNKKKMKKRFIITYLILAYVIISVLGQSVIPSVFQSLRVAPNELNLETPYIKNNIRFTRIAYGLSDVDTKKFQLSTPLTYEDVKKDSATINNIRILDYKPVTKTYQQTQEIRLYYDLDDIDIDRYNIDGRYTQVLLAPRELNTAKISPAAQTWVNMHMVYTHGYGVVMSPVNNVTEQGLPDYLIKDVPPVYTVDEPSLKISRPEIYYGAKTDDYVLVNTKEQEFDYPAGESNKFVSYQGDGGVLLDSFMKKSAFAIRFQDLKLMLSSQLTRDTRIMINRDIQERIRKLTPFFALDSDPYMIIADGRLYWIQDAYTYTGNFPYSEKYDSINYIRNSVKIVVNAYDGKVTYYISEKEPIIRTISRIFPGQFKDIEDMPNSIKKHIRYPEDLFRIQAHIFADYHMDDPRVFYNDEDAWEIPKEVYDTGRQVPVEPYYIIMKLPDEQGEEYVLMTSFTPIRKDNMVAWLCARSDGNNYGKLLVYKFPKDKLVYGPSQIEAKIDQDSVISEQLSLWDQRGSSVTRGNLLVIPIQNSILYVEPLYLQSEQGQFPQLERVIVSDGERVVMEETLGKALLELFKGTSGKDNKTQNIDRTIEELIDDANRYYLNILKSMEEKNWEGIGENLDILGKTLDRLKTSTSNKP